jgi:hypothetical protein
MSTDVAYTLATNVSTDVTDNAQPAVFEDFQLEVKLS